MNKTIITFYPVDNGDCNLIEIAHGPKIMWDCRLRDAAENEEDESKFNVLQDLLDNKLETRNELPFLDAFVLSHADKDHCHGFEKNFYLGNPTEISDDDIREQKILIGELWYSPRVIIEGEKELSSDALAFKKEAERRMELLKSNSAETAMDGNRIQIIGWADDEELKGLDDRIVVPGNSISEINGLTYSNFRMFIHAPFKDAIENASRNETSIVIQFRFDVDGVSDAAKLFLAGDSEWPVWKQIVEKSSIDTLKWNLLEAPHHCSWSFFSSDREKGEPEQPSMDFLAKHEEGAMIISSSKYISHKDSNPPCKKAKNRYVDSVGKQNFFCTGGDIIEDKSSPAPIVFEATKNGFVNLKIDFREANAFSQGISNGKLKYSSDKGLSLSSGSIIPKTGGFYGKE